MYKKNSKAHEAQFPVAKHTWTYDIFYCIYIVYSYFLLVNLIFLIQLDLCKESGVLEKKKNFNSLTLKIFENSWSKKKNFLLFFSLIHFTEYLGKYEAQWWEQDNNTRNQSL